MKFFFTGDELRQAPDEALLEVFYASKTREVLEACGGSLRRVLCEPSAAVYRSAHSKLCVAQELVRRAHLEELHREVLGSPDAARSYLMAHFSGCMEERFVALWLDSQNRLIVVEELFRGTVAQTSVYPREVVRHALARNAAGVMFAHNHPSGVAEPSRADELLTAALKSALALVDVRVLDHFVVGEAKVISFTERGLL